MYTAGERLIRGTEQQAWPQDTTSILLATARDDSSLVRFVSNASRLHSVSLVHACCSGIRCCKPPGRSAMTIQMERRRATHACAKVVGAMRAGTDNTCSSVGARYSSVLAALLGGHVATMFEGLRQAVVSSRSLRTRRQGSYVQTEGVCDELDEWTERRRSLGPSSGGGPRVLINPKHPPPLITYHTPPRTAHYRYLPIKQLGN